MMNTQEFHDLLLNLLHSIKSGDWDTYVSLTSSDLSCFEPETKGYSVKGLQFHKFFFDNKKDKIPFNIEIVNPSYQIFENIAYAAYSLLTTKIEEGRSIVSSANETRIFSKFDGKWKMVHFHRS